MNNLSKILVLIVVGQWLYFSAAEKPKIIICGGCKKAIQDIQIRNRYIQALLDSGNVVFICTNKELLLPNAKRKFRIQNPK